MKNGDFDLAIKAVEDRLSQLRRQVKFRKFNPNVPAEVEVNQFYFKGEPVDRMMIVLRATGCEQYKKNSGCSMCSHFNGTNATKVSHQQYMNQWKDVLDRAREDIRFDINRYPILCVYNLGSMLNPNEVPKETVKEIFRSINSLPGVKKTIIESRAEHVTREALDNIREVNSGVVEVGIGLESSDRTTRELCHHKGMPSLKVFRNAISLLKQNNFLSLTYVNQKPPFLTEKEALDDATRTAIYAFNMGTDAVSIEPTSIQENSLVHDLNKRRLYSPPWLWSVREVARRVKGEVGKGTNIPLDLRLGGYFDETILSGSQGTAPGAKRNEIFAIRSAWNCDSCSPGMITAIKEFNKTYDLTALDEVECSTCYDKWKEDLQKKDPRTIARRAIEILS